MKKTVCTVVALALVCCLCVSSAFAATTTWRCTRPVVVSNLETGVSSTEYIHTASVAFTYTPLSSGTKFTGARKVSQTTSAGVAASGSPTSTNATFSTSISSDGKKLTATFSGFSVSMNYHKYASKNSSSDNPNDYSYGTSTAGYTFTNQTQTVTSTKK